MGCAPEPLKDPKVGKRNFRCGAVFFPCRQLGTSETSAALIIELPIFLFNPSKIPFETSTTSNWSNSVQFHIVRTILLRHPTNGNSGIGLRYISYIPTSIGLANTCVTILLPCSREQRKSFRYPLGLLEGACLRSKPIAPSNRLRSVLVPEFNPFSDFNPLYYRLQG